MSFVVVLCLFLKYPIAMIIDMPYYEIGFGNISDTFYQAPLGISYHLMNKIYEFDLVNMMSSKNFILYVLIRSVQVFSWTGNSSLDI